jgi:hypothetical protein
MLTLFQYLFPVISESAELVRERQVMRAVSEAARQRLEAQGLLQVELDAQKEIQDRVRAVRMNRQGGPRVAA